MNYCRIFTELAETFLEKIVSENNSNKPHFAVKILDMVLTCVGHHDYEVRMKELQKQTLIYDF
jgi:transportin-3